MSSLVITYTYILLLSLKIELSAVVFEINNLSISSYKLSSKTGINYYIYIY